MMIFMLVAILFFKFYGLLRGLQLQQCRQCMSSWAIFPVLLPASEGEENQPLHNAAFARGFTTENVNRALSRRIELEAHKL